LKASTFGTCYWSGIDYRELECVRGLSPMQGRLFIRKTYSEINLTIRNDYAKRTELNSSRAST